MIQRNNIYPMDFREGMKNIPSDSVDLIITSPAYNCRKSYGVYVDEISWDEWYSNIQKLISEGHRVLKNGGTICLNVPHTVGGSIDHKYYSSWEGFDSESKTHRGSQKIYGRARMERVAHNVEKLMHDADPHIREQIVWVKGTCGITTSNCVGTDSDPRLRSGYEVILCGSKNQYHHLGGTGRRGKDVIPVEDYTKDVWFIQPESSKLHPAIFPVELPYRLIKLFCHSKDSVVLDPCMGIGSTAVAVVKRNMEIRSSMSYIGFELNKEYINTSNERIKKLMEMQE